MITDVPSAYDFEANGINLMNMAWDSVINFGLELMRADKSAILDEEKERDYWSSSKRQISAALAVAQQGTEFLLKARIAEVSPYLLLVGDPSSWPRGSQDKDTSYSAFRTVDAQDLVRAHETVAKKRLSDSFRSTFEDMRVKRNSIMHTISNEFGMEIRELIVYILTAFDNLVVEKKWIPSRKVYLEQRHDSVLYSPDHVVGLLLTELDYAAQILSKTQRSTLLGIRPNRRYVCPVCRIESRDFFDKDCPPFAQLEPPTPGASQIYCIVCDTTRPVLRKRCIETDCKGNVIDRAENECLTCGVTQPDMDDDEILAD